MRVDFLTAKLAKENGFILGSSNVWFSYIDGSIEEGTNFYTQNNCKVSDLSNSEFIVYERPTQEELQKWLRDNLIFVEVNVDATSSPKFCYSIKQFVGNPINLSEKEWYWKDILNDPDWGLYRTWEKALEDGLIKGLNLMKK